MRNGILFRAFNSFLSRSKTPKPARFKFTAAGSGNRQPVALSVIRAEELAFQKLSLQSRLALLSGASLPCGKPFADYWEKWLTRAALADNISLEEAAGHFGGMTALKKNDFTGTKHRFDLLVFAHSEGAALTL